MSKTRRAETHTQVVIAGRSFELSRTGVERAMRGVLPDPITSHYVVIGHHRYPPKQVIAEVTGLERAFFTTHHALRLLSKLGFASGRSGGGTSAADHRRARRREATPETSGPTPLVERLQEHRGEWVATKGDELLVAAATPQQVVSWLAEHHRKADSMFRVPEDELAATGLAPL
jgi:hypothetical protein